MWHYKRRWTKWVFSTCEAPLSVRIVIAHQLQFAKFQTWYVLINVILLQTRGTTKHSISRIQSLQYLSLAFMSYNFGISRMKLVSDNTFNRWNNDAFKGCDWQQQHFLLFNTYGRFIMFTYTWTVDGEETGCHTGNGQWREPKQQPIWWPDLALLGCCFVSLYFLCDILPSYL